MGLNPSGLDAYDKRILFELDKDARITTSRLGKLIRRSKQFVDYRINKLEQQKIILGYNTVIDYSRLGYQSMRVYFKFHNLTREQQDEIENDLIKDEEVWWLVTLEGKWDVGYAVAVTNILEFYDYWEKLLKKYKKYIKERSVVVYTHINQFPKSYLVNKINVEKGSLIGASTDSESFDEIDMKLLKLLAINGRMPLLHLSKQMNLTPQAIKYRINSLIKKKIIQGFRALIDVGFLGYRYYKSYINLLNLDTYKELQAFCLQHPNILTTNKTIGGHDFEIELQAKSFEEFDSIMNEIRKNFSGMIDYYEFVIAREEKKMNYFPFL